jgi:hypothetical protein
MMGLCADGGDDPVVSKNSNGVEDLVGKRGRGEVD